MSHKNPLTVSSRNVTLCDFAIFQVKLLLDGAVDVFAFWLSIGVILVDLIAGRGKRPRLFYLFVRPSERFDSVAVGVSGLLVPLRVFLPHD